VKTAQETTAANEEQTSQEATTSIDAAAVATVATEKDAETLSHGKITRIEKTTRKPSEMRSAAERAERAVSLTDITAKLARLEKEIQQLKTQNTNLKALLRFSIVGNSASC